MHLLLLYRGHPVAVCVNLTGCSAPSAVPGADCCRNAHTQLDSYRQPDIKRLCPLDCCFCDGFKHFSIHENAGHKCTAANAVACEAVSSIVRAGWIMDRIMDKGTALKTRVHVNAPTNCLLRFPLLHVLRDLLRQRTGCAGSPIQNRDKATHAFLRMC